MSPNARRIVQAAAQQRRNRGTVRWFAHVAALTEMTAKDALRELTGEGLARWDDGQVYEVEVEAA